MGNSLGTGEERKCGVGEEGSKRKGEEGPIVGWGRKVKKEKGEGIW